MSGDKPVVTIIVVDPGDGADRDEHLARSTSSVLRQSLRGVELLVANRTLSRNAALERAGGDYVIFLDSGNVLDRHAARAAVGAAQDSGADVVSGGWEPAVGEPDPALRRLFRRTAHYQHIAERPELFYDTTISNKLFSMRLVQRGNLRFLGEGTAASLGFVTAAYLQAGGITVVPQRLFVQHLEPDRPDPEELLTVHRALDLLVAEHAPDTTVDKDVRFLEVDLPRYLRGLSAQPMDRAHTLLDQLVDYVDSLRSASVSRAGKMAQIAVFMVRQRDVAGAESVADYLLSGQQLTTGLAETDGRVYWTDRHLDTAVGRAVQDVTALGFHELPLSQLRPGSRIDDLQVHGRTATVRGHTVNPFGRLIPRQSRLALFVVAGGSDRPALVPARVVEHDAAQLRWEASFALAAQVRPTRRGYRAWTVALSITAGAQTTVVPLLAPVDGAWAARPLLTRRRWYPVGNTLVADTNARGELILRLTSDGRVAKLAARQGTRLLSDPAEREEVPDRSRGGVVLTGSLRTKARVLRFVLARLPLRRRLVVFEAHMGLSYSDNPKYVSEELQRRGAGFDVVWSFAGAPPAVPRGVRTVRRTSWRHFLALARARYWVDNQGLPQAIQKPDRVVYLQTWHGSALKRMGEDTPAFRRMSPQRQERHRRGVARWDYFVARSEHDVRTLVPALGVRGEVLRCGYPRNDPLVQLCTPEERAAVRTELGLPPEATLVLYAPTFRETYASGLQDFELPIDLDQLFAKLPDHRLLVRTHYLQRLGPATATHAAVRDVSQQPDITPLMVAADVLVTDYSSVMFDFANTGRPMIFFVYDYDDYAHSERGVYFELAEKAPGPLVRTSEELIQALATLDAWRPDYEQRYRSFVGDFGEYDTGSAARQVVDRVFFGSAGGE